MDVYKQRYPGNGLRPPSIQPSDAQGSLSGAEGLPYVGAEGSYLGAEGSYLGAEGSYLGAEALLNGASDGVCPAPQKAAARWRQRWG